MTIKANRRELSIDLVGSASDDHQADGKTLSEFTNGVSAYGYAGSSCRCVFLLPRLSRRRNIHQYNGSVIVGAPSAFSVDCRSPFDDDNRCNNKTYDYDVFYAQVNVDFGFVTLTAEQMQNVWGAGENGNIILSTKAPAYPQVKLHARISKDIDFTYIHGWLFSES